MPREVLLEEQAHQQQALLAATPGWTMPQLSAKSGRLNLMRGPLSKHSTCLAGVPGGQL